MGKNCIIHFTDRFQTLQSILSVKSLRLCYCKEDFYLGPKKISGAAHPMVSFSKFDINRLKNKVITYGKYGIAFSESWQTRKGINPVLYIDNTSPVANALASLLRARRNSEVSNLPGNLRLPIITLKCFTKNCVGFNSYFQRDNFKFYEENEWRFVPRKGEIGNGYISLDRKKYNKNKQGYNDRLIPYGLNFSLEDIEAIFVKNEKQRQQVMSELSIEDTKVKIAKWH